MKAKPFVKWAGGKRRVANHVLERLPKKIETYYEPFVGGGYIFFALAAEKRFENAVIGDTNLELINTYRVIRDNVHNLIYRLNQYQYSKEEYLATRAIDPREKLSWTHRAARFIYLNKCCFNGLYRTNKKGQFNVPFGKFKSTPKICDEENLHAVSEVLQGVDIAHDGYKDTSWIAGARDAIYFDPPYMPLSKTANFTSYTKDGFTREDQAELAAYFTQCARAQIPVVLSNSTEAKSFYTEHDITLIDGPRSIAGPSEDRKTVKEIIVMDSHRR